MRNSWPEYSGRSRESARREHAGRTLPAFDLLIAHLCLKHKTALLTLDKHFALVEGLRLVRQPALTSGRPPVERGSKR